MKYAIKMSVHDTISACRNYLRYRRHNANVGRIVLINQLTSPGIKSFFGIKIELSPKCESSRDAIRYMKTTMDDPYWDTLWTKFECAGRLYGRKTRELLEQLESGRVTQDVELGDDMAFLATWVEQL